MTTYRDAGVDIDAKMSVIRQISSAVNATHTPAVLAGLGAFGGCFDLGEVNANYAHPVLVASTDGIGTKTAVAATVGHYAGLGADLVHHCINDILCQGATPLLFLDYIAAARLDSAIIVTLVQSLATACRDAGVALLGGETAEMPGVYHAGAFDLAGTIVGVVDRAQMLDGAAIQAGDTVLALPSSGLHTNGYSLARKICESLDYAATPSQLGGRSIGAALLEPHRSYLAEVRALQAASIAVHGLAHITGGGIWDNIPRVLPAQLAVEITSGSWPVPAICTFLAEQAQLSEHEAYHVFNMGLGMVLFVAADQVAAACAAVPQLRVVGRVVQAKPHGQQRVRLVN